MAQAAIVLAVASAAMQAKTTAAAGKAKYQAGLAQRAALEHQARQARQAAGQERASAQRGAFEQRRQAQLAESRALALGAGSGAGTGDPTFANVLGDIGAEGEFRALTAMFQGEDRARNLEMQADLKQFEGVQAVRAGAIAKKLAKQQAFAQLLGGAADAFSLGAKYGGGKSGGGLNTGKGYSFSGFDTVGDPNGTFMGFGGPHSGLAGL